MRRLRAERDPEAQPVRAQREVARRAGNVDPSDDPEPDEIDHRHRAALRLAHVGELLRRVHRRVARLTEPGHLPDDRERGGVEDGDPAVRRVRDERLAEAVALDAARPRRHGNPLHDPARARVDRDEVRLEVGRHERDDATARHRGEEPLRRCRCDERCRSGDEEVAALHAPDYGHRPPRGPWTSERARSVSRAWTSRADPSYSRQGMATRWRDERALVRGAQGGSEAALDELFRLHWRRAHQAAYLVVHDAAAAEDIAQEAFLAAIRNLDRFDRRRPFAPWLHRIVVNRAIDHAARGRCAPRPTSSRRSQHRQQHPTLRRSRSSPRSAVCPRINAPWSSFATCSSTRRARSRRC